MKFEESKYLKPNLLLMANNNFESIKEKIYQNQRASQYRYELFFIVIVLGFAINIISSIIYDVALSHYIDSVSLLLVSFTVSFIALFLILRFLFPLDSHINILNYSYDPFFINMHEGTFVSDIREKLKRYGISDKDYNIFFKRFKHVIKKIIEDEKYNLWNKIIDIEENTNVKEIIIDTSKKNIKSEINILIKPLSRPQFFREKKENFNEYYTIYLELNMYLKNPKNKEALEYFIEIYKNKESLENIIKSIFLLILGYNWNLVNDELAFNIIKNYELEKIT